MASFLKKYRVKLHLKKKNQNLGPGVVIHACNPSSQRLRQEDHEFEANLGYIVKSCLKITTTTKKHPKFLYMSPIDIKSKNRVAKYPYSERVGRGRC
jgi:hypothetical protein